MREILVIGSTGFNDLRLIRSTLREVEKIYHGPYQVTVTEGTALASYVVGAARDQGWTIRQVSVDEDCDADCPVGHRRSAGRPRGTSSYCPTARRRAHLDLMNEGVDLVLAFVRQTSGMRDTRIGQTDAKSLGLPLWQREQNGEAK
jgi:hypothetical protein